MKPTRPFTEADWLATPEPVQKAFIALEERVLELEEKVEKLTALVEKLEARLNKNSGNSSKPPSSDGPFKRPKSSMNPNQKGKPGGKRVIMDFARKCFRQRKRTILSLAYVAVEEHNLVIQSHIIHIRS